jgi:group I intron endonuclease
MMKYSNMPIHAALLKYGYSSFTLEILEYCAPSEAITREQYYLDLLNPDYNILKKAGSTLGYKHSPETIAKLKGRKLSEETIAKLKVISKSRIRTAEHKAKLSEHLKILHSNPEHRERLLKYNQSKALRVEVLDTLNNEKTVYNSISEAGCSIGVTEAAVRRVLKVLNEKGVSRQRLRRRYMVYPVLAIPSSNEIIEEVNKSEVAGSGSGRFATTATAGLSPTT